MVLPLVALVLIGVGAVSFQVPYLLGQGWGLLQDLLNRRPVEQVRRDPHTDTETLVFLDRVEAILGFAHGYINLADPGSYRHVVQTDRSALAYVVSASPEFEFRHYRWRYPFFGSMPYRGYFNRDAADHEARRLRQRGYDTLVRGISAFSTLGYLPDPLYPFMARFPVHRLANTIIHELAHATLWLTDQDHFNEQFATFVGDEGSRLFVAERYGKDSPEYALIQQSAHDRYQFRSEMVVLRDQLRDLYAQALPEEIMRARKRQIIEGYQLAFAARYDEYYRTDAYRHFSVQPVNNAYLNLFRLYTDDIDIFYDVYRSFDEDFAATVRFFLEFDGTDRDPYELMQEHLLRVALERRLEQRIAFSEAEVAYQREVIGWIAPLVRTGVEEYLAGI